MRRAGTAALERRAARLTRLYPATWRDRYGDEFVQFLIDEMEERPRSAARFADVLGGALRARVTEAGLGGEVIDADRQLRTGLAVIGVLAAGFVVTGVAVWSQLTVGWQWSAPTGAGTRSGMLMMSVAMLVVAGLVAGAVVPLLWVLAREFVGGRGLRRMPWLGLALIGTGVLVAGSVHFGRHWPGTGGHAWSERGLVPSVVARFCWAATLWVTSYWAHPGALSAFPGSEIAWMVAGPLALSAAGIGTFGLLRGVELPRRVLAFETWAGLAGVCAMALFLAGAASWVLSGAPRGLFRVGTIDVVSVGLMAGTLVLAWRLGRRNVGLSRQLSAG